MSSITDLTYTDNMAANKKPLLTDLRASLDSIQTYINQEVKAAVVKTCKDAFPSGYAFATDEETKNFTSVNLFDKQNASNTYTGGDITISTTGSWEDVDASNAQVTLTPDTYDGDFKVDCQFNIESVTSNATNETDVLFRLTDGSSQSESIARVKLVTGVTGTTNVVPVNISAQFSSLTGDAAATIKLQYQIVTSTASTIKVLAGTNNPIVLEAEKI